MGYFLREIFCSSLKRAGYGQCLSYPGRQVSLYSTKGTTSSQLLYSVPKFELVGGTPVVNVSVGQPTPLTHPHKLLEGEIVPGIKADEFQMRRRKLVESLMNFSCKKNDLEERAHLIVIPSAKKKYMSEQIPYIFRQNSDFLYLTGCMEPDSILVIKSSGNGKHENILFLRGKDPHSELWDGPRTGFDQVADVFGIENALPLGAFESFIKSYIKENTNCFLWYDFSNNIHPNVHKSMKIILSELSGKTWESPRPFLHRLRLYKSPAEQELMKKSCDIGAEAIKATIKNSRPLDSEALVFARVDYECRMRGAEYLAYPPVVAGGNRANIIHYVNNDQVLREGDLVLMDAGCEYRSYTCDITRTWPISGKFSPIQRILQEVVYSVQVELIRMCFSFPTLDHLFKEMCGILGAKLQEAGIISNKISSSNLSRVSYAFCPHHVSHYLGMDVHDTSTIPRTIPLEPGMVFTIEPGVYVNVNNKLANPEFRGQGIRIEDDVLMTDNGPLVLTSSCPKHPDDLEDLINPE